MVLGSFILLTNMENVDQNFFPPSRLPLEQQEVVDVAHSPKRMAVKGQMNQAMVQHPTMTRVVMAVAIDPTTRKGKRP